MPDLIREVQKNIESHDLLKPGQRFLVAVSGGLDSMVLLDLLCRVGAGERWRITVAHLNHQLRWRSSDADERLVRRIAKERRLPIVVGRADIRQIAQKGKLSIEMAARKARHEFLAQVAVARRIGLVAVAHHADDQVELFFLRLFRGAGSEGLSGMKWRNPSPVSNKIELIRPLLDIPKAALAAYALENKVRFREDATNRSLDIKRNLVRHELLPLIRKKYQPAIGNTVSRVAEILSAEADYIAEAAEHWLYSPKIAFDRLPVALQRRVLQLQLLQQGVPPQYELIEKLRLEPNQAVSLVFSDAREFIGSFAVLRDPKGIVHLRQSARADFSMENKSVSLKNSRGEISFAGTRIKWSLTRQRDARLPRFESGREFFDADKIGEAIILRHWLPGDRFQPIGMAQAVKLQDLLVNQKVPKALRHRLIVATAASGELFWVEKLRISERFKLSAQTKRRLQWHWRRA